MPGEANKWKKARQEIDKSVKEENSSNGPAKTKVLALDCEYVVLELEGQRIFSIVNVDGETVYDEYVLPTEKVTDYRVHVSGIRIPFTQAQTEVRKILSDNIVVWHSIQHDFQVSFFSGLPSLKLLAHHLLGVQIQQGEHRFCFGC
ncbi:unnamed protein product [Meloidogyne enterolobii]|uniref:Uncharacterized protein n=2 Tax=Meloidogyne enterolobii TaxID=390850 RepID=A0ACB0YIU4_MELEN